jgi:hypothetical protein
VLVAEALQLYTLVQSGLFQTSRNSSIESNAISAEHTPKTARKPNIVTGTSSETKPCVLRKVLPELQVQQDVPTPVQATRTAKDKFSALTTKPVRPKCEQVAGRGSRRIAVRFEGCRVRRSRRPEGFMSAV